MFYFHPGMGRLKSTVNGSTFLWVFKCLMGNGNQELGMRLSTVFLDFRPLRPRMDTEQHSFFAAAFLAGIMMNFCLTVIFLGLTLW